MHAILITAGIAYLLGSIPFGYLLVKAFHGTDVRTTGSGNIGATNVARMAPGLGLVTLFLDAAKGLGAVLLAALLFPGQAVLPFLAGFAAVAGHIFPVWLGVQGGQGVGYRAWSIYVPGPQSNRARAGGLSTRSCNISIRSTWFDRGECIPARVSVATQRRTPPNWSCSALRSRLADHCEASPEHRQNIEPHR